MNKEYSEKPKSLNIKMNKSVWMKKNKIGIDIDEVVVNFIETFLKYSNLKYNTQSLFEDVTTYNLWECGLFNSKEESIKRICEFQNSDYFDKIDFIDGAKKGIENIADIYDIYFITSRPNEIKDKTKSFFYSNFPKNRYKFIFSGEIYGGKTKSKICDELGIKVMVEDNSDYALDCAKRNIKTFLLDKPWNRNHEEHKNIIKVKNWENLIEKIIELKK